MSESFTTACDKLVIIAAKAILALGVFVILACVFGGYLIGALKVDPFFGFTTEGARPLQRLIAVDVAKYGFDSIFYEIVEGGAGEGGIEVSVQKEGKSLIRVGGDTSTYVGLIDVDGNGTKELLVTSLSVWSEKGVWTLTDGRFVKIEENTKSRIILSLARILMYSPFWVICSVVGICAAVGILLPNKRSKQREGESAVRETVA